MRKAALPTVLLLALCTAARADFDAAQLPANVRGFQKGAVAEEIGKTTSLPETVVVYRNGDITVRVALYSRPDARHDDGISPEEIKRELLLFQRELKKANPEAKLFYRLAPVPFGGSKLFGYESAWTLGWSGELQDLDDDTRYLRVYFTARDRVFVRLETIHSLKRMRLPQLVNFVEDLFAAALGDQLPQPQPSPGD